MLKRVQKQSLSQAVFQQLQEQIMSGSMSPGSALPSERVLCEALGVNRGAVREALRRLEQARLVVIRQGGSSSVLDYRVHGGLDLLPHLLLNDGKLNYNVIRSVMEMRSALAPDVARLAAERGTVELHSALQLILKHMEETDDISALQNLANEFWTQLVRHTRNVAYELTFNSLHQLYDECRDVLTQAMAEEFQALADYRKLAQAIFKADGKHAAQHARSLTQKGEAAMQAILDQLERHA